MTAPVLAAVAPLAALGLAWLEWHRRDRRHVGRRMAASVVAVTALAMLGGLRAATHSDSAVAVVVTEGADPAVVRRVADSARGSIYVLDGVSSPSRFGGALDVPDIGFVFRRHPATRQVIVVGWGVGDGELDVPSGRHVAFVAARLPPGIAAVRWPPTAALGSEVVVRGTTTGVAPGTRLRLDDAAGPVDSARVASDSTFRLATFPKTAARLTYILRVFSAGAILAETLGVSVVPHAPPRLLVLDGAPSFETRYLKDWMAAANGALTVRTEISRRRYRTTSVNRPIGELNRIDSAALASYDVVLVDTRSLAGLGPGERGALNSAVRSSGLGVILRPDAAPDRSDPLLGEFGLVASGERTTRLTWENRVDRRPIRLAPLTLRTAQAATVLVTDSAGAPVAARMPVRAGAVAVTLAATPSRWRLGGEPERFASYWSLLIGSVARPAAERWAIEAPALVDVALQITRFGGGMPASAEFIDPEGVIDTVYLTQDRMVPTEWHGTYWPRTAGWHRINGDSASLDFDVRPSAAWHAVQASTRRQATDRLTGVGHRFAAAGRSGLRNPPLSLILFLAFVAAVAVLWADRADH